MASKPTTQALGHEPANYLFPQRTFGHGWFSHVGDEHPGPPSPRFQRPGMCLFGDAEKLTTKRDWFLSSASLTESFLNPDPFGERLTISTLRSVVSFALREF
ncbi:hypothetical protein C8R45DRAFT_924274 [Mycena sanguinolenta]|nr:hypothetical protein C8R45DRAFT_924274 [Mycena sanguinolenta]